MATLFKHLYNQPENLPRELITAVPKCNCKESTNGLFCSSGKCKCSNKPDNSGCNILCKCDGSNCYLKQQKTVMDSVQNISLDEIPESPTKRVRFLNSSEGSSEDSEIVNEVDFEASSSSSDEVLIHLPIVFSSRRLTIQQQRRIIPTLDISMIGSSYEINISHFTIRIIFHSKNPLKPTVGNLGFFASGKSKIEFF